MTHPKPPAAADAAAPAAPTARTSQPPVVHEVAHGRPCKLTQHLLAESGPSKVQLPQGSRLLDIHVIDGRFYLRTLVPVDAHPSDVQTIVLTPAALGSAIDVTEGMVAVNMRQSGIHFFADLSDL